MNRFLAYLNIVSNKRILNYLVVRKPPSKPEWKRLSAMYSGRIIGISSNRVFPQNHPKIASKTSGWLHCFKDSTNKIPIHIPKALISESDFCNTNIICLAQDKKLYDLTYSCFYSQKDTKNFSLLI